MSKPILFVGTSTIDYIALVDKMPKTDHRIDAIDLIKCGGGPAANAAVTAKKLGAECSLISVVGDDLEGKEIIDELEQIGISTYGVQISSKGNSPRSLIFVEKESGYRTIAHYGGATQYYDFENYPLDLLENSSLVHADGNCVPLTLHTFKRAKEKGITTLLDGGNITKENLLKLLPFTDVLITDIKSIPSRMYNNDFKSICEDLVNYGPHTVGITLGKDGAALYDSYTFIEVPSYRVDVVDTTGAGDNFHGAYAFAYWYGLSSDECLKLSNLFAGLSCKALGGRGNLLSYDEIKELF